MRKRESVRGPREVFQGMLAALWLVFGVLFSPYVLWFVANVLLTWYVLSEASANLSSWWMLESLDPLPWWWSAILHGLFVFSLPWTVWLSWILSCVGLGLSVRGGDR